MHVGVAKTGTTYLQRILQAHRDALKHAGVLYPGRRSGDQFVAAVDLRGAEQENFDHLDTEGAWDRLTDEVRRHRGNAVISHETFARSSRSSVERAAHSFGDSELKVVLTLRDLGRQIPAVWQETIKNRSTIGYHDFLDDIFHHPTTGTYKFFWKAQDFRKVVRKWGGEVGMENVTVVTVPQSGAPRDELWNRFADAIDLPEVSIQIPEAAANTSIGPAEAELLRHVNAALPDDFPWPRYIKLVKRQFAERRLAPRSSGRIVVPPEWHDTVKEKAARMVDYLEASGVRVVGDLADLTPVLPVSEVSGPDDLSREELMTASAEVVRDLVIMPRRSPDIASARASGGGSGARAWLGRLQARLRRG
jgi:hypothetical protein